MRQQHGCVRALDDSAGAIAHVVHGMDAQKCASFKRAQFYAEDAVESGLLWFDFIPGDHNPSDILTKHSKSIADYQYKNGIVCGSTPHLYETIEVRKILDSAKR